MNEASSLSFSFDCIDYQYRPESLPPIFSTEDLNIYQFNEKSLSSSFIPLPPTFLSVNSSYEAEKKNVKEEIQSESTCKMEEIVKFEENCFGSELAQENSLNELGLEGLINDKKMNTKNVLRNFGNAQTQYVLHNKGAQQKLREILSDKSDFEIWVRKLRLIKFEDYQSVWNANIFSSLKEKLYKKIYRKLCWTFYEEDSIPYIFNSRLNSESRKSHIVQVYKMVRGILNPKKFDGFKE